MKAGLGFCLGCIAGAAGGFFVTNLVLRQQYAQKADEEIAACREAFLAESEKLREKQNERNEEKKRDAAVEAVKTYSPEPQKAAEVIRKAADNKPKTPDGWKPPYVIDPALFDAPDNPHKTLAIRYYPKDGVVAEDPSDKPYTLDELDRMVGREALAHFGNEDSEIDRVCVRNDNWKVDYEICMMPRSYKEVLKEKPWLKV